jgi:lipopolysaccharide export system protein LptA
MMFRASLAAVSVLLGLALGQLPAPAQTVDTSASAKEAKTPRNVDIEADSMEIFDQQKKAIFKGNVKAVRGKVTLNCDTLDVSYTETPDAQGEKKTDVTFLDAVGNVVIVSGTQTVTGKTAHMDVKANKLTVKGGAKVVQGQTVMNGEQLFVDLNTNKSEMTGGRVKGSFVPSK